MRIVVLGASGGIGREVVRQGFAAGHEVTAIVRESPRSDAAVREWEQLPAGIRSPAGAEGSRDGRAAVGSRERSLSRGVPRVQIAVVASLSASALAGAVDGRDAVVSALGPPGRSSDPTVNSRGVQATVEAMRSTTTTRIVAVSAAPLFAEGSLVYRGVIRPLLWAAFRPHYEDLVRMERILADSGLDWTTVRPPKLTDRAGTGHPVRTVDGAPRGAFTARADVATAILQALADPATIGHHVGVAGR
jgi:putative NADH-flavin reductase